MKSKCVLGVEDRNEDLELIITNALVSNGLLNDTKNENQFYFHILSLEFPHL